MTVRLPACTACALLSATLLSGCAGVTVLKVAGDAANVVGQRYYLPKPVIQVAPQQDGTIAVSVLYLPDKSREYAVDAYSWLSSYSLQVLPNPDGTLAGIDYQGNTTAVAQQAAASAGAIATQVANYHLAQAQAQQTAVSTAQAAVDAAQASADAASAALAADTATNAGAADPTKLPVSDATLASDASTAAQAQAKLAIAKQALQRVQSQSSLPSVTLTAGGVVSTSAGPSPDSGFTGGTWTAPAAVTLPGPQGAVLYALNDTIADGKETVKLEALHTVISGGTSEQLTQKTFDVSYNGLGPPTLLAPSDPFSASDHSVVLRFSRSVINGTNQRVLTGSPEKIVSSTSTPNISNGNQSLTIDTTGLKAGKYRVTLTVTYAISSAPNDTRPATVATAFELQ